MHGVDDGDDWRIRLHHGYFQQQLRFLLLLEFNNIIVHHLRYAAEEVMNVNVIGHCDDDDDDDDDDGRITIVS